MFDEKFLDYLETNYEQYCLNTDLDNIKKLLDYLDNLYYNTPTLNPFELSDSTYDWISNYYYSTSKKNKNTIGFPVNSREKVKLPQFMGSMDKIKPNTTEFDSFFKKFTNDKCISEKLDGISLLLEFNPPKDIKDLNDNQLCNIYTRGDGTYGKNINHIKKYLNIYSTGPTIFTGSTIFKDKYFVRGELIVNKNNWNLLSTNPKGYNVGKNARNFISGFTNRKDFTETEIELFKYIDFVAFELIHPYLELNQEQQLLFLGSNLKIKIVKFEIISNDICKNKDFLKNKLVEFRNNSIYEIDGIIIQDNIYHKKISGENPKFSKAFKNPEDCTKISSNVIDIEWNITKDGLLKPVIIIETIHLDGVDISRVTGNNARFITENNITYGSTLTIIRSGGVIPKIVQVINNQTDKTELIFPKIPWEWDKNKVEFISTQKNNKEIIIKQIEYFINVMGIEFYKISNIIKGYNQGIIMSIDDIYNVTKEKLMMIEGIKEKSAEKILYSIQSKLLREVNNQQIGLLASATPFFRGLGTKRLELIFNTYPDILNDFSGNIQKSKILKLNGFSDKLTNVFIDNVVEFKNFLERNNIVINDLNLKEPKRVNDEKKIFVFSGFRDKNLKQKIIDSGNIVSDSITNKTNYLIVKDLKDNTEKIKKAKEKGIKIISKEQLLTTA